MKKPILPTEIVLRFYPSKFLWGWWLFFSMAVLLCLWGYLLLFWAIAGTLLYMLASLWQWTQLVATHWRFSVQSLSVNVYGEMTVTDTLGQLWRIKVLPDSMVHHGCMVLNIAYLALQTDSPAQNTDISAYDRALWRWLRTRRLLILFDHADAEAQKTLRVWLKWGLQE